jgi:hypothetical protein
MVDVGVKGHIWVADGCTVVVVGAQRVESAGGWRIWRSFLFSGATAS